MATSQHRAPATARPHQPGGAARRPNGPSAADARASRPPPGAAASEHSHDDQLRFLEYANPSLERRRKDLFPYKCTLRNPLPELPFDPKLLPVPTAGDFAQKYRVTSLEEQRAYAHHTDRSCDNGVPMDWIAGGVFDAALAPFVRQTKGLRVAAATASPAALAALRDGVDASVTSVSRAPAALLRTLHPKDQFLLLPMDQAARQIAQLKRAAALGTVGTVAESPAPEPEAPAPAAPAVPPSRTESINVASRDGQIKAIERSFELAGKIELADVRHPHNPELRAVEFFPVTPDFENWAYEWSQVSFTESPTDTGAAPWRQRSPTRDSRATAARDSRSVLAAEALLRPFECATDPHHAYFGYYLADDASVARLAAARARLEAADDGPDVALQASFELMRDYSYEASRHTSNRALFRVIPQVGAVYVGIAAHLKCTKRPVDGGAAAAWRPARIDLIERLATAGERDAARDRLAAIMTPDEAEEWAEFYGGGVGEEDSPPPS